MDRTHELTPFSLLSLTPLPSLPPLPSFPRFFVSSCHVSKQRGSLIRTQGPTLSFIQTLVSIDTCHISVFMKTVPVIRYLAYFPSPLVTPPPRPPNSIPSTLSIYHVPVPGTSPYVSILPVHLPTSSSTGTS